MSYHINTTLETLRINGVISTRTLNSLIRYGLYTIKDVLDYAPNPIELMSLPHFGRKSYYEIGPILKEFTNTVTVDQKDADSVDVQDVGDLLTQSFEAITTGNDKITLRAKTKYISGFVLHRLIANGLHYILRVEADFTPEENIALRRVCRRFIEGVLARMEENGLTTNLLYENYKKWASEFDAVINEFSLYDHAHYFMSAQLHEYIQVVYQTMSNSRLGTRARSFKDKYLPSFEDAITYFGKPISNYSNISPIGFWKKTITEIYNFNQEFEQVYNELKDKTDVDLFLISVKRQLPHLDAEQQRLFYEFYLEHRHIPLFNFLYEYLLHSDNRTDRVFMLRHGFYDDKEYSIAEISQMFKLSRERIRQLSLMDTTLCANRAQFASELENYHSLLDVNYLSQTSPEYQAVSAQERLPYSFEVFALILCNVADFDLYKFNRYTIVINRESKLASVGVEKYAEQIEEFINARHSQECVVTLSEILKGIELKPKLAELLTQIAVNAYHLEYNNGEFTIPQNYIDISGELYQILLAKGEPMSVTDLFSAFKAKYPAHPYTDPMQIKTYLYRHEHIRPIGKQSLYGLDFWTDYFYGNIRDLIYRILSDSPDPVHIDVLYSRVARYFPKTNVKSIVSSMQSDTNQRFTSYNDGFYGIKGRTYRNGFSERTIIHKHDFEYRLRVFRDFVATHHRYPITTTGDEEASLRRWFYNVKKSIIIPPTEELRKQFFDMIAEHDRQFIPRTGYESEFLENAKKYRDFVAVHHREPTQQENADLYWWYRRATKGSADYIDFRRLYFARLQEYLKQNLSSNVQLSLFPEI